MAGEPSSSSPPANSARAIAGKVNYARPGVGTPHHIAMAAINDLLKLLSSLPDLPTLDEAGLKGHEFVAEQGVLMKGASAL